MLARAPSISRYLTRGVAALGLSAGAATVHHEASSATPAAAQGPPPVARTRAAQEPSLSSSLAAVGANTTIMKDECVTAAAGDGAAFECGDLRLVHALPATTTMGTRRTPTLIYNSRHENGTTVFPLDVTLPIATVANFTAKVI